MVSATKNNNTSSTAAATGARNNTNKNSGASIDWAPSQGGQAPQVISAKVRKTIQSIKEIFHNFSDNDIYLALKEADMEPNETIQKLLSQDPFHEVRRKRDKRKESQGYRNPEDTRKHSENFSQGMKVHTVPDRNPRSGGYTRTALPGNGGTNREFRVVRDNRVNQNSSRELKPASAQSVRSGNVQRVASAVEKGSTGTAGILKRSVVHGYTQASSWLNDIQPRHTREAHVNVTDRKVVVEDRRTALPNAASRVQNVKPSNSQHHSATLASSNSVVGVYSSSTDPVHVPSPDSRPSAAVGAIKREVGVVGGRRQSFENTVKDSSASGNSFSSSVLGRDQSISESFRSFSSISKSDQVGQTGASEPVISSISIGRPFLSHQNSGKLHQQAVGHQKATQHNKEWKPKSSQKSSAIGPGVIGAPTKSNSPPVDSSKGSDPDGIDLQDKLSHVSIYENQNVVIAQHIRVPETDKLRLTFGSFAVEVDPSRGFASGFQAVVGAEESNEETAPSLSVSAPEASSDDASASKQVDSPDDRVRNSGSDSPEVSEHQLPDKSSSTPDLDNYADIGLVQDNGQSYDPSDSQQQQDPPELQNFSAYDPQSGYDISYFRPPMDETVQGQGLPSPQEVLNSHAVNNIPSSTASMVQQQQQQQPAMAQMYPQVHVSHFANLMPYRQFLSPVYVPQMAIPGYSSNPAYPHPSNGNSYLLMPGGSSHLGANGLKYGIQQFKPVPGGSPTGFGNFTTPTGYSINAPGVVGSGTGLDDSSRLKYKEGSLYVPNPQAETSEMWVQNPRDLPGLQSSAYYNMPGQTPAFMPSHTGHASFNAAAAAQSSHMHFPGLYPPPPPQPAAMGNPHHLGPVMGGNVGVGVAPATPGGQVGAYQQPPQLGHLNWTTNF